MGLDCLGHDAKIFGLGADPGGNTLEQFARLVRIDRAKWFKLMKQAGLAPDWSGRR